MKLLISLLLSAASMSLWAQPSLLYTSQPSNGLSLDLYVGSIAPPGGSGPNQTWDFSSISLTKMGTFSFVDCSSTPFQSSYPTANFCYELQVTGQQNSYNYNITDSVSMFTLAENVSSGNPGKIYTPNPKQGLKFPFNYLDSFSDPWARTDGGSGTVTRTYDAYGTLITSLGTNQNVVRITSSNSTSNVVYYHVNPIFPLLQIDTDNNIIIVTVPTNLGLTEENDHFPSIMGPLPADEYFRMNGTLDDYDIRVLDLMGREYSVSIHGSALDTHAIPNGIYLLTLSKGGKTHSSIICIQHP